MRYMEVVCPQCGAKVVTDIYSQQANCTYCHNTFPLNTSGNNMGMNNNYNPGMNGYNPNPNMGGGYMPPINKKKKKTNKTKIIMYIIFSLVLVASAIVFAVDYFSPKPEPPEPDIYKPTPSELSTETEDATVNGFKFKLAEDIDIAAERKKHNNNQIVGRLEIPELFNVLVAQSNDNSYYLTHSVDKEYDIRGTEFLDYRVKPTSKQINIYGHNTRDTNIKVAFLKLEKFLDKEFFDSHPYIIFQYEGGKALYEIKSIKEISETNGEHMKVDLTGQDFIDHFNAITNSPVQSRNISINAESEILVLQTCSHHWDNALYIVTAVKLDYKF